jgi:hypothetical protein
MRDAVDSLRAGLDRHARVVLIAVVIIVCATLVVHARAKHFWHDEIYTILASRLPVITVWQASRDGLDLAPPLNTILTRLAHAVLGVGPVSTRLPPMAGFLGACLLLFVMVRRRSNALLGLSAVLVPCFTVAYQYAYEARGYDVALGTFTLALFAWSEAAAGRGRRLHLPTMAIALSAGVWAHYYAVLAFVPIAAGELVRQIARRRLDLAPWAALLGAGLGALPLVPLAAAAAPQAATFWTRLEPVGIGATYGSILAPLWSGRMAVAAAVVILLLAVDALRGAADRPSSHELPAHEVTAGLGSLAIPALGALIGMHAGIPFVPRYVLFAVAGFAMVISLAVWRSTSRDGIADVGLCLMLVGAFAANAVSIFGDEPVWRSPVAGRTLLTERLAAHEQVALSGGISYLELWYHLPPEMQHRAVYLADPEAELRQTGSDTIDRGYLALARWAPVPVIEYGAFVRQHREFPVYVCGRAWLGPRLRDDGASIEDVRPEAGCWTYHVRLPAAKPARR